MRFYTDFEARFLENFINNIIGSDIFSGKRHR